MMWVRLGIWLLLVSLLSVVARAQGAEFWALACLTIASMYLGDAIDNVVERWLK